jgi:phosphatidylinositol kinase/protein kinase (PI-3  family)
MSIVGYVIGLGDQHFANSLFDQKTGSVIDIDIGEFFDQARTRELHKEFVAFRRTRMMRIALGPRGHTGRFKSYCQETVHSIRDHQEAVTAELLVFTESPIRVTTEINRGFLTSMDFVGRKAGAHDDLQAIEVFTMDAEVK